MTSDISLGRPFGCCHGLSTVFSTCDQLKNPLLMHCHKVQQSTGSKKCHYSILSRETDRQHKGTGLNSCSSNTGDDFTQHTQHAPFCVTLLLRANSWILWNTKWGLLPMFCQNGFWSQQRSYPSTKYQNS